MPAWGWLIVYLAGLWLQLTVSSLFPTGTPAPDLFLVLSLVGGLLRGPSFGIGCGLVFGLTGDLISGRLIGLGALSLALAGALAGLIARRVFRENLIILAAVALLLSTVTTFVYAAGAWILGVRFSLTGALMAVGLPVGIYSAILVPVVYAVAFHRLRQSEGARD